MHLLVHEDIVIHCIYLHCFVHQDVVLSLRHRLRLPRQHGSHMDEDLELTMDEEDEDEEELTRDDFNLHKMIVITTAAGKVLWHCLEVFGLK